MSVLSLADLPAPPPHRRGWPWTQAGAPAPLPRGLALPSISVVTPSLNQGAFIEETIRSVLLQGYPRLEYIVIDGGSTDGTLEILARYVPYLHWSSGPDAGQADAINRGMAQASGEILAYLNSDDSYLPGALHAVAAAFLAHPAAGLVYGDCLAVSDDGSPRGLIRGAPYDRRRMIQRGHFVPQQAAFWRRRVVEAVGPFDTTLHFCMDHDFFIRAGAAYPAHYLPQTLACFRFHDHSKSVSQMERHWRESMAVSRRYGLQRGSPWYWVRTLRHHGLRLLPVPLALQVRRWLNRAHDPLRTK